MKLIKKKFFVFIFAICFCGFVLYSGKVYFCCNVTDIKKTALLNEVTGNKFFMNEETFFPSAESGANCSFNQVVSVTHSSAKKSIDEFCASDERLPKSLRSLPKQLRQILLGHLIVNDEYKFIYCFTPKVACSNWKKVIKQLYGNFKQQEWVKMDHMHGFSFLSSFNESEIMRRLQTYFKFMFIRNPVERALSVYRNKFNDIESFYKVYGKKIMSMYHDDQPKESYRGKIEGDDVAFEDFLRYIATGVKAENMNEHYMPMTTLCQPCLVNYDFVGIYDNLEEDAEIVLQKINSPENVHFPTRQTWYKPTTDIFMQYYFSLISPTVLSQYLTKYDLDFKMFSFPLPYFLKSNSQHSNGTFCFR